MSTQAAPLPNPTRDDAPAKPALARRLPLLVLAAVAALGYGGYKLWDRGRP